MITIYGIKNCDTVRKARAWLEQQGIAFEFRDVRETPLEALQIQQWIEELGWTQLINRRSTTWKQLDPKTREDMSDKSACQAILTHPTLIKRPVLDTGTHRHVGFSADVYQQIFS